MDNNEVERVQSLGCVLAEQCFTCFLCLLIYLPMFPSLPSSLLISLLSLLSLFSHLAPLFHPLSFQPVFAVALGLLCYVIVVVQWTLPLTWRHSGINVISISVTCLSVFLDSWNKAGPDVWCTSDYRRREAGMEILHWLDALPQSEGDVRRLLPSIIVIHWYTLNPKSWEGEEKIVFFSLFFVSWSWKGWKLFLALFFKERKRIK